MGRKEKSLGISRLRQTRRAHGRTSLAEFAESIGYSASYLSAVELGHLPETDDLIVAYEAGLNLLPGSLNPLRESPATVLREAASQALFDDSEQIRPLDIPDATLVACSVEDCLATALSFIEQAETGPIYLTSQGFLSASDVGPHLHDHVVKAILVALHKGNEVIQLVANRGDRQNVLGLMQGILPLLGQGGEFQPLMMRSDSWSGVQDIVAVPGVGVLIMFMSGRNASCSVLAVRDPLQVDLVLQYCRGLAANATPFVRSFPGEDALEFERYQAAFESVSTDRQLVKNGLSAMVLPESWYRPGTPWAEQTGLRPQQLAEMIDLRLSRVEAMKINLGSHWYRDVCPTSAIEHFVRHGRWPDRGIGPSSRGTGELALHEKVDLLEAQVDILRNFEHYELALVDADLERILQQDGTSSMLYWVNRPGVLTIIERWPPGQTKNPIFVAIAESAVAASFGDHFRSIWSRVPPRNRDKDYVIWYLERAIASVRGS